MDCLFTCSKFHLESIRQAQNIVNSAGPIIIVSAHTGEGESGTNISL